MNIRATWNKNFEKWVRSYRKRRLKFARWLLNSKWFREAAGNPLPQFELSEGQGGATQHCAVVEARVPPPIMSAFDTELKIKPGICVIGYLNSEIGLGQSARCLAYALDAALIPSSFHHLSLPSRENEPEFKTKCIPVPDRKANLLVYGLPSITTLYSEIGGGRHNILYPFWELHGIKQEWLYFADRCAEVWAPSTFVADAFMSQSRLQVTLVRQPVQFPKAKPLMRKRTNPLTFLTYFDYDSYGERKNPKATVKSFCLAFPQGTEDVRLVVKTRGGADNGLRCWLADQCATDARIEVIDRTIDRASMERLVDECDVFVSLHRSEGFGFGAAEALAASKVVISTDYSGTTDFIDKATGYPIAYSPIPVREDQYLSASGQFWADADIDDAAAAMKSIYDDPDQARKRAEVGRQRMLADYSPAVIGQQIRSLLDDRGLL